MTSMDSMKEAIPYQPELDAIDWRTSTRRARNAIVRHVPLILASCAFSLVLLIAYVKIFPPIYTAEAVLQAEQEGDVNRNNYYSLWNLFRKGDLKSEPELVTSGRVARQVVDSLKLKFDDVHHTPLTQISYLWTESWVGKRYRAFKEWLFSPDGSAYKPTQEEIDRARTVDAFKDGVSVESVPGTTIGRVIVKAPTYRAAEFANKIVEVYLAERGSMFLAEANTAYKSLAAEVERAAADLAAIDKEKLSFDMSNKVVLDFEKDKLLVANWAALQASMNELKGTIASAQASLEVVENQLAIEAPEIVSARSLQDSKVKGMLQAREFELNSSLQQMRERYQPSSPEIMQLERSLAETRSALAKEPDKVEVGQERVMNPAHSELRQRQQSLRTQLASAKASLEAKRAPLAQLERRMNEVPQIVKAMIEQGRIREGLEARYKLLRDRAMMADVSRAAVSSAPPSVRVIDYATPPMKQTWPKMIILVPSVLALGLFLGFGLALLAELFSSRVNRDRLSSRPEFPVYAVVSLRPDHMPRLPRAVPEALAGPGSAIARLRGPS